MKLEYSVNLQDIITFNKNHIEDSPVMRRKMTVAKMVWSFTPLLAIMAITYFEGASPAKSMTLISFVAICVSAPIFLFQPTYFRWCCARQIRKIYSEGENQELLGAHEMEIANGFLIEKTEASENKFALSSIEKVVSVDEYTYIYTGAAQAHVIPKNSVASGNYDQFVAAVKKKTDKG